MASIKPRKFRILGDNLAIDFVNTRIVDDGKPKDLLSNFEDFLSWQNAAGLLELSEAETLAKRWLRHPETNKVFRDLLSFRKTLREIIEALASGKPVKLSSVETINKLLQQRHGYYEIVKTKNGFQKVFRADLQQPRQLLMPIAESTADLLSFGDPKNVKKCESSSCILYFYDTTKNHRRRWCSMTGCGNRAKAAAFYERKRKQEKALLRKN